MGDLRAYDRLEIIRKMFFKTKFCSEFQLGTCPYGANCNYAHSIEEKRKPPPNWREVVDAQELREDSSILVVGESDEKEESLKWKYSMDYNFTLDEETEVRGSDAIYLVSGSTGMRENQESYKSHFEALHWKIKLCNSWELSRRCPYGSKCRFAHGVTELRPNLGWPMDKEVTDPLVQDAKKKLLVEGSSAHDEKKKTEPAKTSAIIRPPGISIKLPSSMQNPEERRVRWKGPDKISKVYGDWIDDL